MTFRELRTATGLLERDFRAIKHFLLRSTVPLICETESDVGIVGSGCLFDRDGHLYFVTAGHVLDGTDPEALGVPLRTKNAEVFSLGTGVVSWSRNDAFDVAAYRIDDDDASNALRAAYVILGPANTAAPSPNNNHFVVAGYPAATVERNGFDLSTRDLTQIHTSPYAGDVIGSRGEHDLFLKLKLSAHDLWGNAKAVPKLPGISGGPVWQVHQSNALIWTPESALTLVAIQVSCDPRADRYMRALRWEIVDAVLREVAQSSPST